MSLMLCSNSCMSGRKWAWPRSGCTSVTSTAQNVLTVVLPETPTVPGMVSPVPDIILLECTLRGNHTYTQTPTHGHKCILHSILLQRCLRVISTSHQSVLLCQQNILPWMSHDSEAALSSQCQNILGTWRAHVMQCLDQYAASGTQPLFLSPASSFSPPLSPLPHFHNSTSHVENDFFCFSRSAADDSGGRMFAMATPSSCAMGCKLMVSVLSCVCGVFRCNCTFN